MSIKTIILSLLFLISTPSIAADEEDIQHITCYERVEDNYLYVECTSREWGVWELFTFDGFEVKQITGLIYSNSNGAIFNIEQYVPVSLIMTYSNSSGVFINYKHDIKLEFSLIGDFI